MTVKIQRGMRRQFNGDRLVGPLVVWVAHPSRVRGLCGLLHDSAGVMGVTVRWPGGLLCVALSSRINPWRQL